MMHNKLQYVCLLSYLLIANFGQYNCFFFKDVTATANGLAYPHEVTISKGQNIMIKLLKTVSDQEQCLLKLPNWDLIDLADNKNRRITKWDTECSVKIMNVEDSDQGRWQLQSMKGNESLLGVFTIFIQNVTSNADTSDIIMTNSDTGTTIDFGYKKSVYCSVSQSKSTENNLFHGGCSLPVEKVSKNLQGPWEITYGVKGQVNEEALSKTLRIISEDIDVGYTKDSDKNTISLHCNLRNSKRYITFCRYERMEDEKGFNLVEGLGYERYSYKGKGIRSNECGLSIERPNNLDFGTWRCDLGVAGEGKTDILRRIITVEKQNSRTSRTIHKNDSLKVILSVIGKPLTVNCKAKTSLSYCWLRHPNGTHYTLADKTDDSLHWASGNGLEIGDCSMTFKVGTAEDSGLWTCHMGQMKGGMELIDYVEVRVGGSLVSVQENVYAKLGQEATIECVTAGGREVLNYCRFSMPSTSGFNINDNITLNNAIQGLYYIKEGASLNSGDCTVTIKKVEDYHAGVWTCAATLENESVESISYTTLEIHDGKMSTASVTGIAFGFVVVVIAFAGFSYITWKKHRTAYPVRPDGAQEIEMSPRESEVAQVRTSDVSETSTTALTMNPDATSPPNYGASQI